MDKETGRQQQPESRLAQNKRLINEAIKRILLDVVVRGHGDRLIGRWSREPSVQRFLEQVPYMLDRINQLHLVCMRGAGDEASAEHRHRHRHHHHHHKRLSSTSDNQGVHSPIQEFVNLVGREPWLVRTRDALGLTPLHKVVLHQNVPLCEFILDRYPDELAAGSCDPTRGRSSQPVRLIDSHDKYGRTALHYAAASAADPRHELTTRSRRPDLYRLLLARGASSQVCDFRGKSPDYYARHPKQLRARSIIHLANKLNANYQASVLSRTLRSMTFADHEDLLGDDFGGLQGQGAERAGEQSADSLGRLLLDVHATDEQLDLNRESMSLSCANLATWNSHPKHQRASLSKKKEKSSSCEEGAGSESLADLANGAGARLSELAGSATPNGGGAHLSLGSSQTLQALDDSSTFSSPNMGAGAHKLQDHEAQLRRLAKDRSARCVLDNETRLRIRRQLNEGKIEQINALLVEGHGPYLLDEASGACWNQQCRQHLLRVVPKLLEQLDTLHELVATNQLLALKMLVAREPSLVRMRRPYKRAAMNALHLAVQLNRGSIVAFLLERFPELVGQRDSQGATCLHWAARSLRSDRLYCWLSEHFSWQLDGLRDSRGKTATDYRQQAIRLASFEGHQAGAKTHKSPRASGGDVRALLQRQQASENELRLSGAKRPLIKRADIPARRTTLKTTVRVGGPQSSDVSCGQEPTAGVPAIQQGRADSPAPARGGRNLGQQLGPTGGPTPAGAEHEDEETSRGLATDDGPREGLAPHGRARPTSATLDSNVVPNLTPQSDGSQTGDDELASRGELLTNELVQLEVDEAGEFLGGASAATPTSEGPGEPSARQTDESANWKGELPIDELIRQCIRTDDFKKLEHLLLAGCGPRIAAIQRELSEAEAGQGRQVGAEMHAYLERRAFGFMQTIGQIHATLHRCYSHVTSLAPSPAGGPHETAPAGQRTINLTRVAQEGRQQQQEPLPESSKRVVEFMNSNFHKLCNLLLASNCFLMARDSFGASPCHVALIRSDRRLLDYLLRREPNAASAPDHESRTALHYAAIVLAVYERHGPVKLVVGARQQCEGAAESNAESSPPPPCTSKDGAVSQAHWLVDSTARTIYENLCARYGPELDDARDRRGKTHAEYRTRARREGAHVQLDRLPRGLYESELLRECCPEYADMLKRYDYLIWVSSDAPKSASPKQALNRTRSCSEEPTAANAGERLSSAAASTKKRLQSQLSEPAAPDDEHHQQAGLLASPKSRATRSVPLQAAAKPAAGQFVVPPPLQFSEECDPPLGQLGSSRTNQTDQTQARQQHSASRQLDSLLPSSLDPRALVAAPTNSQLASGASPLKLAPQSVGPKSRPRHKRHHHRRSHSGRPHGAHLARHSVVGGVIVPTIIHNDQDGAEIQSYDIVYRQPPSSRCSSSSSSSLSSCSSSPLDDQDAERHSEHSKRAGSSSLTATSRQLSKTLAKAPPPPADRLSPQPKQVEPDELSLASSSSSAGEHEEDERVERLSSEFEDRVRREKNELRARVDQIMKEIKLSAKSTRSSRFLSSPNDLNALALTSGPHDCGAHQNLQRPEVLVAGQGATQARKQPHKSSISSAGTSKTITTSGNESLCSSPNSQVTCTNSQCSSASLSVDGDRKSAGGRPHQSRKSSCSSAATSNSRSSSTSSSPVIGQTLQRGGAPQADGAARQEKHGAAGNGSSPTPRPAPPVSDLTSQLVSKNTYGQTYLHFIASKSQSSSTLYKVLGHASHLIGERDVFYRTARDVALQFNWLNNVQLVDKFVIDLFIKGRTGLLWALLQQGYSPLIHVSDTEGNDVVLILKLLRNDKMIQYLLRMADFQRWRDELHTFIRNGYLAGVSELIKKHRDLVRAKSVHARTSVHLAVLFDRVEMLAELVAADPASVHAVDNLGRTPLHYAFGLHLKNGDAIRARLTSAGARMDFRDVRQRTPKYYYIFRREIEEIRRIELELN